MYFFSYIVIEKLCICNVWVRIHCNLIRNSESQWGFVAKQVVLLDQKLHSLISKRERIYKNILQVCFLNLPLSVVVVHIDLKVTFPGKKKAQHQNAEHMHTKLHNYLTILCEVLVLLPHIFITSKKKSFTRLYFQ
jgi:hypothetical protein